VTFVMDEETKLADLLALNLHNFEDEVRGIVDKATKELSMEKVLAELNNTWSVMEVEYEPHYRTSISLLKTSEELIETLEDNQVIFQYYLTYTKVVKQFTVKRKLSFFLWIYWLKNVLLKLIVTINVL